MEYGRLLEIRPARESDQSAIVRLWHRGWHDAHAHLVPSEILKFRTLDCFSLWLRQCADAVDVALRGNGLVGFTSTKGVEVVKLFVDRDARGTGVAAALLSHAERRLFAQGVAVAELYCTAGNSRAERFYERQGWQLTRTFDDALWLPDGAVGRFSAETHRYEKRLAGSG